MRSQRLRASWQHYGAVSQPPPGVEHTYTPDIIIFDCPSPGKVMVGDVTIPHPPRPSSEATRVRQHQGPGARVLKVAGRAAKDKERKVRSFLDALYAEKAILPPADSQFVALPVETYGAVHPDVKRLFDWLVNTWIEQTLATSSLRAGCSLYYTTAPSIPYLCAARMSISTFA